MNIENPRKRKKGIETTGKILDAAANLFSHKGYDNVSLREIADAVGIKESSLYNHFESKADILTKLFELFIEKAPEARPSLSELDSMLIVMQPEEIFKYILFHFGKHVSKILENIAIIISNEKYRNIRAAEMYYQYVVGEPSDYYEHLIKKMVVCGKLKKIDARVFAEQYNYVSIALTKEYFMAENGLADVHAVVRYMVKTIDFFCSLMKE